MRNCHQTIEGYQHKYGHERKLSDVVFLLIGQLTIDLVHQEHAETKERRLESIEVFQRVLKHAQVEGGTVYAESCGDVVNKVDV